jgi:DNA-binding winged helix-turn-helix (wHTH) protein
MVSHACDMDRDPVCSARSCNVLRASYSPGTERRWIGGRALAILTALIESAGEIVTKRELFSRVWPDRAP